MRSTTCPECRWVSVVDASGRRRLEMRWVPASAEPPAVPASRAA